MVRIFVIVIVMAGLATGCKKQPQQVPQPETTTETQAPAQTPEREAVTQENLDQQIDKMQQEIDTDAATEQ